MRIRDVMTTEIESARLDDNLQHIARKMKSEDVGSIPIVDNGELVGIITDRDIVVRCIAEGKDPKKIKVEGIISRELRTIGPDASTEEAAELMAGEQVRRLPVVEDGELIGMVSLGDLAVKEGREEVSEKALEGVSEGVKSSRGPQLVRGSQKTGRMEVEEGVRGRAAQKRVHRASSQGITSRSRREEDERQARVHPGRTGSSRRKAG